MQYCHIHTDHVYASDHKWKMFLFYGKEILTLLLIAIVTKNQFDDVRIL